MSTLTKSDFFICFSCGENYCADESEPFYHTNQCPDCWDDSDGECYSRNQRRALAEQQTEPE